MMDTHYGNYWPPSFGWSGRYDPFSNPNVLTDFTFDGVSFGKMNRYAVPLFTPFLAELVPHLQGGLHVGKCGCYNPKSVAQSGTRSFHTFGIAIDVNWDTNPMGGTRGDMPHDVAHSLARKYGLEWGGDWDSPKDQMHFEIHLAPDEIPGWVAQIESEDDVTPDQCREIIREELRRLFVGSDNVEHTVESIVSHVVYNFPWKSGKGYQYPGVARASKP